MTEDEKNQILNNRDLLQTANNAIAESKAIIEMQKAFIQQQSELITKMHNEHLAFIDKQAENFNIMIQLTNPINQNQPRDPEREIADTIEHLNRLLLLTRGRSTVSSTPSSTTEPPEASPRNNQS